MSNDTLSCSQHGHSTGSKRVTVRFNVVEEFLEEFAAAPPGAEPVMRVTRLIQGNGSYPIESVSVLAAYLRYVGAQVSVQEGVIRHWGGELCLVELRRFCGERHVHEAPESKAELLAQQTMAEIEAGVLMFNKEKRNLDPTDTNYLPPIVVRAGRYEV